MTYDFLFVALIYGVIAAITAILLAPLQYLKIQKQEYNINYLEVIQNKFKSKNYKSFFNGAIPYMWMNFISSLSFGFFDCFSLKIIDVLHGFYYSVILTIIIRSLIGGFGETIATIYFEMKEVIQNKELSTTNWSENFYIVTILILIRNAIIWSAAIIVFELTIQFSWHNTFSTVIATILGIFFGFLTTPLDVLITNNCGIKTKDKLSAQLINIIFYSNYQKMFAGGLIRLLQMGIYSAVTLVTMFLLKNSIFIG